MALTKTDDEPISLTLVGDGADAPDPLLRPSPATGDEADRRDVEDPTILLKKFRLSRPHGG